MRRDQLQLFEVLRSSHHLVGQIGVTTAGMDGPALMGLPTACLTDEPNVRLGKWVGKGPRLRGSGAGFGLSGKTPRPRTAMAAGHIGRR